MSSEPSQHGWQATDRYESKDRLFDAPAAPDEFPSFTPFSASGHDSDPFPPDSDPAPSSTFGGFPSDDPPAAPAEWASSVSEHYVPAPAVMPIPGVRHDMESSPASWATTGDSFGADPYPPPATEREDEEPSGSTSSSWAAFAAGDNPKPAQSGSGSAWSDSSAPAWEDHPLNESRREEPSWGDSSFAAPEPEAVNPVSPVAGVARAAAAVSVPGRVEPQEPAPMAMPPHSMPPVAVPPAAMPPAATAKPAGRVYGSASVTPPAEQSEPAYAPPPPPQPAPASGPVRASARASVNVAKPAPGEALPQGTRSSTVYGSAAAAAPPAAAPPAPPPPQMAGGVSAPHATPPAAPHTMGAAGVATPPAPPRQGGRPHAFGDLLGPETPAAPASPGPIPAQRGPAGPGAPGDGTAPPFGAPPPPPAGPANPGAAARASASVSGGGPGGQSAFDQFKPATTPEPAPAEQKPERKGRIIAGVLVGCVALLALAFGGLFLVDKIFNSPAFVVGDCVKQNENVAVRADCSEAGAFQVKAAVSSPTECQDQSQPHVQQKNQILCLAPVAASAGAATPAPTASPNQ